MSGSLVVRGGKLIIGITGKLTTNNECCCECVSYSPNRCECQTQDFPGSTIIPATLYITITGSTICNIDSAATLGIPCDDKSGHNWNGTYVITCDEDVVDDPERTFGKTVTYSNRMFFCSQSNSGGDSFDYYLLERIVINWRIGDAIGFDTDSRVTVIFITSVLAWAAGDDPDVDPVVATFPGADREYVYRLPVTRFVDGCDDIHRGCGHFVLDDTNQGADIWARCGHSTPTADFQPSDVKLGNIV